MRIILLIFGLLSALVIAFLFAGYIGAVIFGIILNFSILIFKNNYTRSQIPVSIFRILFFSVSGYLLMLGFGLFGANELVARKVEGIKRELIKDGHNPKWFIISQKRSEFYNNLLTNSVKNGTSKHLVGHAIDLFIIDINSDGEYDKTDFELMTRAAKKAQKKDHTISGHLYDYFHKGYPSNHMVHVQLN